MREITVEAKTTEEAVSNGAKQLGVPQSAVTYEVLRQPKKGFLGFGAVNAQVLVRCEEKERVFAENKAAKEEKTEAGDSPKKAAGERQDRKQQNGSSGTKENRGEAASMHAAEKVKDKVEEPKKIVKTETTKAEDSAVAFLKNVISDLNLNAEITVYEGEEGENNTLFDICGADAGTLIGHHGETLDALQCLAGLIANRCEEEDTSADYCKITIDIENYRRKREVALRKLARRTAAKVQKNGRNITLEPMNPYERRIIHSEIQNIEGVSTNSIGTDNNRRIVVYPIGAEKPTEDKSSRNRYDRRSSSRYERDTAVSDTETSDGQDGKKSSDFRGYSDRRGGRSYGDRDRRGGRGGRPERDPNRPRQAHPVMVETPDGTLVERKTEAEAAEKSVTKSVEKSSVKPYYMKPKSSTISRPYQKTVKKDSVESYYFDLENSNDGLTREKEEPSEIAKACGIYEDDTTSS